MSSYSRERFDGLWQRAKTLGFANYPAAGGTEDIGASKNYVITIGASNGSGGLNSTTYLVPKCGAKPEIKSFVMSLTQDLLPAGSPGLLEPCVEPANEG